MKSLIVTGSFNNGQGKPSYFGQKISEEFDKNFDNSLINGGHLKDLEVDFKLYDVLVWMPNVDNSIEKIIPDIKTINPKLLLVSSKRVIEKEYTEFDVIGRLLKSKSNLGIMITKSEDYNFKVLDPLGNCYIDTNNITEMSKVLIDRIKFIKKLNRIGSLKVGNKRDVHVNQDFLDFVKYSASEFTKHVNAINPNRILGNASTRCMFGFPAQKTANSILVTQRNIDKKLINHQGFVEVENDEETIRYYGDVKPSVDTPIQIKLFNFYKNANYMVHGHVYIENAPFTDNKIPCGFIEEFDEIIKQFPDKNEKEFAINLKGHGCLLIAENVDGLWRLGQFKSRDFPEN